MPSSDTERCAGAGRRFEIRFAAALPLDRREEVVLRLHHQRGVHSAWFDPGDPRRLQVCAEPAYFSALTLRDFVRRLWVGAKLAGD